MKTFVAKGGEAVVIREAVEQDAEKILQYSKTVFASTDQVLTTLDEFRMTVEEEKRWINTSLHDPSALTIVADLDGEIIGLLFFVPSPKMKSRHVGEFGVTVHPHYQSCGIGKALVQHLLGWARAHDQIEKVFLNVFATNEIAFQLYKNLGFIEEGRFLKSIKQPNGEYVDVVQMYIHT